MDSQYADDDPFADPPFVEDQRTFIEQATLNVGRNASLTLGTDSLIVLGNVLRVHAQKNLRLTPFKMKGFENYRDCNAADSCHPVSSF
jgi:hypothetical protein